MEGAKGRRERKTLFPYQIECAPPRCQRVGWKERRQKKNFFFGRADSTRQEAPG